MVRVSENSHAVCFIIDVTLDTLLTPDTHTHSILDIITSQFPSMHSNINFQNF
jgi:hypothetical protein